MNPYQVLGVSPSASQEEIREAYMKLVKKYHPDRYQDSNLKQQAEDKMKQINAAYDMLTKKPSSSSSSSSYGPGSSHSGSYYGGYGQYSPSGSQSSSGQHYSGQYYEEFRKVRSFINAGRIAEAEALLAAIPLHNAEWYFLYGMCCYRNGHYGRAYEYVSRACQMDPDNDEYVRALNSMRGAYSTTRSWTEQGSDMSCCSLCTTMLCANLLCNLCFRGQ